MAHMQPTHSRTRTHAQTTSDLSCLARPRVPRDLGAALSLLLGRHTSCACTSCRQLWATARATVCVNCRKGAGDAEKLEGTTKLDRRAECKASKLSPELIGLCGTRHFFAAAGYSHTHTSSSCKQAHHFRVDPTIQDEGVSLWTAACWLQRCFSWADRRPSCLVRR